MRLRAPALHHARQRRRWCGPCLRAAARPSRVDGRAAVGPRLRCSSCDATRSNWSSRPYPATSCTPIGRSPSFQCERQRDRGLAGHVERRRERDEVGRADEPEHRLLRRVERAERYRRLAERRRQQQVVLLPPRRHRAAELVDGVVRLDQCERGRAADRSPRGAHVSGSTSSAVISRPEAHLPVVEVVAQRPADHNVVKWPTSVGSASAFGNSCSTWWPSDSRSLPRHRRGVDARPVDGRVAERVLGEDADAQPPGPAPTSCTNGRAGAGAITGSPGNGADTASSTAAVSRTRAAHAQLDGEQRRQLVAVRAERRAPARRLQPDEAAAARGDADRPAAVVGVRERHDARRDRRRRTAARTAGRAGRGPTGCGSGRTRAARSSARGPARACSCGRCTRSPLRGSGSRGCRCVGDASPPSSGTACPRGTGRPATAHMRSLKRIGTPRNGPSGRSPRARSRACS